MKREKRIKVVNDIIEPFVLVKHDEEEYMLYLEVENQGFLDGFVWETVFKRAFKERAIVTGMRYDSSADSFAVYAGNIKLLEDVAVEFKFITMDRNKLIPLIESAKVENVSRKELLEIKEKRKIEIEISDQNFMWLQQKVETAGITVAQLVECFIHDFKCEESRSNNPRDTYIKQWFDNSWPGNVDLLGYLLRVGLVDKFVSIWSTYQNSDYHTGQRLTEQEQFEKDSREEFIIEIYSGYMEQTNQNSSAFYDEARKVLEWYSGR